jgi:hypothetical protein
MRQTDEFLQRVDRLPLLFDDAFLLGDLSLLLLDGVDKNGGDLRVFHAFYLAVVVGCKKRLDLLDFFRRESDISLTAADRYSSSRWLPTSSSVQEPISPAVNRKASRMACCDGAAASLGGFAAAHRSHRMIFAPWRERIVVR